METSFSEKVIAAVEAKTTLFDETILPGLIDKYRILHTSIKNLFELLIQKSLIKDDPYKLDKKISDVVAPDSSDFMDTERPVVMGARLSDYETMLDFICTYFKFSVDNMPINQIKKFVDLNNTFSWSSVTVNSPSANTRGLAALINEARQGATSITNSMITDVINRSEKAIAEINKTLKELTDFQKEVYKARVRKDIFDHPKFDKQKAQSSLMEENQQIRKLYQAVMGSQPFYASLVDEILKEDHAPNKAALQQVLLEKLKIRGEKKVQKSETVDTKEMLMTSVHSLSALAPQYETIYQKIMANNELLQNEHTTFFDKLKVVLRKAFNLKTPEIIYNLTITDRATQTVSHNKIIFQELANEIQHKANYYNSFSVKKSPGYQKIESSDATQILDFVNKNLAAAQKNLVLLDALDEYFKQAVLVENRNSVKGLKMELTSIKNTIIKTNQHRAEYLSYMEEQEQMKKLGITNEK